MIDNKVRYEIDGSGAFISQTMGSVRALTDYTTMIELVSPLPLDTSVMVNFLVYDARNIDLPLFMIPNGKKGWQVSNNPLVADWNVWEVGIDQKALAAISKYRAGRIGVSFTFRERRPSNNALNYKGVFDEFNPLPSVGENNGDYYVCRGYNIVVSGTLYTYNDNAVWQVDKWVRDRNMRVTLTTTTIDLPVDPALLANVPDVPEQDIADLIAQWGGGFVDMESHINNDNIHVSPSDRNNWDGMLPRDGSEPMEGNLDMNGNTLEKVADIEFEQGGRTGNLDGNDFTIILPTGEVFAFDEEGLDLFLRKLLRVAKGVNAKDGANMENIADQLPRDGSRPMTGNLDVGSHEVKGVTQLSATSLIAQFLSPAFGLDFMQIFANLNFNTSFGIKNLAKGIIPTDGANVQNIIDYILEHNNDETAHLYLRELIDALQREIDRLNGKGKTYGQVDYLQSELVAMTDSQRDTAIVDDILSRYPSYERANGDLVYTKNDGIENAHEWEYNGTIWFDNGAYTVDKASNTEFGIVSGNDYVSIVAGLMQILKSDYATRLGDASASLTYNQLNIIINALIADIANRYTKSEVYNKGEIDILLAQLKAVFGWEDTLILNESSDTTYDSDIFGGYDYVWLFSDNHSQLIKTSLLNNGDVITLGSSTITIGASWVFSGDKLSAYGIKMDGSLINEVRDVGETNIVRNQNGNVYQILGDQVIENIERDANGRVIKVTEEYVLDGKIYETTFVRDSNGSVISYKKVEVA